MPSATQSCEIWQRGKNGPEHVTYVTSLEVECPSFGFLAVPNHNTTASSASVAALEHQGDMEFHPQPWSLPVPDAGVDLR